MPTKTKKPRARYMTGVNRLEQAQRIKEIILALPVEKRTLEVVKPKLLDKGIELKESTIYAHLKKVNGGGASGNGSLLERVEAVSRALKVCGGMEGLNETVKLVRRIGKVLN